jgi:hypothetical protein
MGRSAPDSFPDPDIAYAAGRRRAPSFEQVLGSAASDHELPLWGVIVFFSGCETGSTIQSLISSLENI